MSEGVFNAGAGAQAQGQTEGQGNGAAGQSQAEHPDLKKTIAERDAAKNKLRGLESQFTAMQAELATLREAQSALDAEKQAREQASLIEKGKFDEAIKAKEAAYQKQVEAERQERGRILNELKRDRVVTAIMTAATDSNAPHKVSDPVVLCDAMAAAFEFDDKTLLPKPNESFFRRHGIELYDSMGNEKALKTLVGDYVAKYPTFQAASSAAGGAGTRNINAPGGAPDYLSFLSASQEQQAAILSTMSVNDAAKFAKAAIAAAEKSGR